jgi:hypothetical protein
MLHFLYLAAKDLILTARLALKGALVWGVHADHSVAPDQRYEDWLQRMEATPLWPEVAKLRALDAEIESLTRP